MLGFDSGQAWMGRARLQYGEDQVHPVEVKVEDNGIYRVIVNPHAVHLIAKVHSMSGNFECDVYWEELNPGYSC